MKLIGGIRFVIALFASITISTAAWAQRASSAHTGDYVSVLKIGSYGMVDDVVATTGIVELRNDSDAVGALGVVVGYNWAKKGLPIRSEIEYHYRARFDFDSRVQNSAGYEDQLSTHALIVNVYYDHQMSDRWAVFAGGGIGWAQNVSDVARVPLIGGAKTELVTRTNNLTWNAALGVIWSFARSWDMELRYRYIDLGEVESGPHIDGTTITASSYTSHDLILGITYRL